MSVECRGVHRSQAAIARRQTYDFRHIAYHPSDSTKTHRSRGSSVRRFYFSNLAVDELSREKRMLQKKAISHGDGGEKLRKLLKKEEEKSIQFHFERVNSMAAAGIGRESSDAHDAMTHVNKFLTLKSPTDLNIILHTSAENVVLPIEKFPKFPESITGMFILFRIVCRWREIFVDFHGRAVTLSGKFWWQPIITMSRDKCTTIVSVGSRIEFDRKSSDCTM